MPKTVTFCTKVDRFCPRSRSCRSRDPLYTTLTFNSCELWSWSTYMQNIKDKCRLVQKTDRRTEPIALASPLKQSVIRKQADHVCSKATWYLTTSALVRGHTGYLNPNLHHKASRKSREQFDPDLFWLAFNPSRAMVMIHTHAKIKGRTEPTALRSWQRLNYFRRGVKAHTWVWKPYLSCG